MSPASDIETRLLRPDDDVEAELDLRRRAFGPIPSGKRGDWLALIEQNIGAGELVGAFDGAALIGSARFHPMRQWWRGRPVPMAGVAGVKVAPEHRGRGIGRALMVRLIAEIADRGYPLSALFPATAPLYRSLGWELAGGLYDTTLPMTALAGLLEPDEASAADARVPDARVPDAHGPDAHGPDARVPDAPAPEGSMPECSTDTSSRSAAGAAPALRRAGPGDAAAIIETLGRVYSAHGDAGPATRDPQTVARWLDDEDFFAYLAGDGFLGYRWSRQTDGIRVELLAAASAPTAREFWQIVASHGTMADTVYARLGPDDPVNWLTREPAGQTELLEAWMLRLVDAGAAVAARGFPAAVSVSVPLQVTDSVLPANSGLWTLEVSGGQGKLARTDSADGPPLRIGARGLAALYGGAPLGTLRGAGLVAGGSAPADEALDSAFGGRPAFMLHSF